jgi:hypothetical protein
MKLYQIEVQLYATAYVKAETEAEALIIAQGLEHDGIYADSDDFDGLPYTHLEAAVTFSPAMTVGKVLDDEPEEVHDYDS